MLLYFKQMRGGRSRDNTAEVHSLPRSKVVELATGDWPLHADVQPGRDAFTS